MKRPKKTMRYRMVLAIVLLSLLSCPMPLSQVSGDTDITFADKALYSSGEDSILPISVIKNLEYPYGIKSAAIGTDEEINAYLKTQYDEWKALYVTSKGAGIGGTDDPNYLRVQRDSSSNYDTVSEGQAYGMLLAVYFNDSDAFAKLLKYANRYRESINLNDAFKHNNVYPGLMHWMIDANGNPTTEFNILPKNWPKDFVAFVKVHKEGGDAKILYLVDPANPTYQVTDPSLPPSDGVDADGPYTWLQASQYDRTIWSSATDADVDMAAALVMASKLWPNKWVEGSQYHTHATSYLKSLLAFDIERPKKTSTKYWLKAGNLWGGQKGWNPCYYTPAWLRMFKNFIAERAPSFVDPIKLGLLSDNWGDVSDNSEVDATLLIDNLLSYMYTEMQEINALNGTTGLYPDWINTNGTTPVTTAGNSDRRYYFNTIPTGRAYLDWSLDTNNNGILEFNEAIDAQSLNFYYDAVRTPWRIAMDYSFYGEIGGTSPALNIAKEAAEFFKPKLIGTGKYGTGLKDGYSYYDTANNNAWKPEDKDGFNMGNGGQDDSVTFIAMCGTASMVLDDLANAQAWYQKIKDSKEDTSFKYNYYGNTVRLLALLYMSGRMVNFGDIAEGALPRQPAVNVTVGPLTIDTTYTNYAAHGIYSLWLNDRSGYFNSDKTTYANVSGGLKDYPYDQKNSAYMLNLGYCTYLHGATNGLPYTFVRDAQYDDWILGTGTVWKSFQNQETHPWSTYNRCVDWYKGDPGLMDYSIDMENFTPDLSNNKTIPNNGDITLGAANYGDVKVMNNGAKLRLSGGIYHMNSFTTEPDAKIYFDTSSKPIVIFVKDQFTIRDRTKFLRTDSEGADPSRILFVVGSTGLVTVGPQCNWRGTLIAPNANYVDINLHCPGNKGLNTTPNPSLYKTLNSGGEGFGAIWGSKVQIHQDSAIFFTPLDWTAIAALNNSPSPPPTPSPAPGGGYDESRYTAINTPFTKDGNGEYRWMTNSLSSYINSWNLTSLTINGIDYTNKWTQSTSITPASDTYKYYISYKSSVTYGHFEAK